MFKEGFEYTRDDIHSQFGGSKQSYLPTKGGLVVAACLTKDLNSRAPQVILCGRGPIIESSGAMLASQGGSIPVFLKRAVNRWEFQGRFRVKVSFTAGREFDDLIMHSGRSASDLSRAIVLEKE